jgi:hypothetical protein
VTVQEQRVTKFVESKGGASTASLLEKSTKVELVSVVPTHFDALTTILGK